jgi:aryl-alcohol dehydrogenase-like predicted oxidoreductase
MKYTAIVHTALNPSAICLGTLPFGLSLSEETSFRLLDRFYAEGGNFLDTALVYGEWLPGGKGLSEKTVGKWVKARGNRHDVMIGTKGAHPRLHSLHPPRLSPQEIRGDLQESLHNLHTDYIDLYWLHRDDPNRPVAEIVTTLNEQVKAGTIRYFGCSNWRLERIKEAQDYSALHGMQGFAGNQLMWSLAVPNQTAFSDPAMVWMDGEMKAYHQQSGLAAMAYTSQARGFFARLAQSSLDELPEALKKQYGNQENLKRMARLKKLAEEVSLPLSVLSLAYIVSQPFPAYAISGCSNMAQLLENLRAGDVQLEPGLLDYLDN